ncbi:MAG: VWA domain-containing protein [Byssovorax sp.]
MATKSDEAAPCIEVQILWGASVLHVAHRAPSRPFHVGEAGASGAACDCFVPASALGVTRAPVFVAGEGDTIRLVILAGMTGTVRLLGGAPRSVAELVAEAAPYAAIEGARLVDLPRGASARLEIGGVVFVVSSAAAAPPIADLRKPRWRSVPFWVGSGLLHVGLLGSMSCFPASPSADDLDGVSADQVYAIQAALEETEEKAEAERETEELAAATADAKEGGTGVRARGEEGSMGQASTSNRYGVSGPNDAPDPHVSRAQAVADASEFGMIGLLNQGAGGDPNAQPEAEEEVTFGMLGVGHGGGGRRAAPSIGGAGLGLSGIAGGAPGKIGVGATSPPIAAPLHATIDPNGRFATTYRPGGGHLAAFESAVARGIVPAGEREIVSDVGARYTPALAVPEGHALAMRADLERGALPPNGGPFHVRLALQSSAVAPATRPHLSVHLVLDVSGSMAGDSIASARSAAAALVDKLAPTDDFSLVTFSSDANVIVPDGAVGARRGWIKDTIGKIKEDGGTNIGEGLRLGYEQAALKSIPDDAVRVVFLVSDGHANFGVTGSDQLSRLALAAFQKGIQTSSFGLGSDYDGALMSSIADDGSGGYYYLRNPDQIAPALSTELDRRLDPVATTVEVRVRLKPDVGLLRVYGSKRLDEAEAAKVRTAEIAADAQAAARDHIKQDRQSDAEGGMRFFIPAFARDDAHALLFRLDVPAGMGGRTVAGIELKYKDRLSKKNVIEEVPIQIAFADSDAASAATINASVARTVQGFGAGEALTTASWKIANGDRDGATALLTEREAILRAAAGTLHEPLFLRDADRLARLRASAGSQTGSGDPLVLAMLLETAGRTHLR